MPKQKSTAILPIALALSLVGILGSHAVTTVLAQPTNSTNSTAQPTNSTNSTTSAGGPSVSIVLGASASPGPKSFSPNPISIKVGDTVTWTNKDSTLHTATSGTGASDPNAKKVFDSGLSTSAPGGHFSHKFTTAGTFPYFCQLHPTMTGTVIVK